MSSRGVSLRDTVLGVINYSRKSGGRERERESEKVQEMILSLQEKIKQRPESEWMSYESKKLTLFKQINEYKQQDKY